MKIHRLNIKHLAAITAMLLSSICDAGNFAMSSGAGDWNSNTTWGTSAGLGEGVTYPGPSDNVTIATGKTITIPSSFIARCASLTIGSSGSTNNATLSLTDNTSGLTVSGTLLLLAPTTPSSNGKINTLNLNGGTVSCGMLDMQGSQNLSNIFYSKVYIQGGSLTVSSINANTAVGLNATTIYMTTANCILNMNGDITTDADNLIDNSSGAFGTINYKAGATQVYNAIPSPSRPEFIFKNLSIESSAGNKVLFANTPTDKFTVKGNLTVNSGSSIQVFDVPLYLAGNLTDNNTTQKGLTIGTGQMVCLNGSSNQTVSSTYNGGSCACDAGAWFNKLRIYNSAGITLSSSIHIADSLNFKSGIIASSATNKVVLEHGANTSLGSSTCYVNGYIERRAAMGGGATMLFPIGSGSTWRPFELTPTHMGNNSYSYTANLVESNANDLGYPMEAGTNFSQLSRVRYYQVDRTLTSTGAAESSTNLTGAVIKIYYKSTYGANDGVSDPTNLGIAKTTAANEWKDISTGQSGSAQNDGYITSNTFTSFSKFSLSNKSSGNNSLPVSLTSFEATCQSDKSVLLKWSTASEINNDRFVIEKSIDGDVYETISQVKGAGNSSVMNNYEYSDNNPISEAYYRLNQIDLDGKIHELMTIRSTSNCLNEAKEGSGFSIYPNPSNGGAFNVSLSGVGKNKEVIVVVLDITGKEMYSKVVISERNGSVISAIDASGKLSPGIYFVTATSDQKIFKHKLIVE